MVGTGIFFHLESSKVCDYPSICLCRPYIYTVMYSHVLTYPQIHIDTHRHIKQTYMYIGMRTHILWCVCVCENCMHAQCKVRHTQRLQLVSMCYQIFERSKSMCFKALCYVDQLHTSTIALECTNNCGCYCTYVLVDFRVRFQ